MEPESLYVKRARRLLNKGINPRRIERELRNLGASNSEARRAIHEAARD
jgi:hypothetical protein